ncbi:MAG: SDR family oxidoreductase, partial [Fimbriimonadaceae bacterium]
LNAYGRSKFIGERNVLNELEKALVVRTSWLYGPVGRSFPKAMLEAWLAGKELKGVVDECGTPTYAPWLAQAVVLMMHAELEGGIYHLAGQKTISRLNFARLALEVYRRVHQMERPVHLEEVSFLQWTSAAKRPQNASLDSSLLRSKLGLAEPSLGEQLQDFVGKVSLAKPG